MTFVQLPPKSAVFVDANTLVYHFQPHPSFGPPATALIKRIELQDVVGFTSTHVLAEAAHRLMMIEAAKKFGWKTKPLDRLKQRPTLIAQLSDFQNAIAEVPRLGIQTLAVSDSILQAGVLLSRQIGLFTNDALIVAVMQAHGLTNLASGDADFDRVPGLTRYGPV